MVEVHVETYAGESVPAWTLEAAAPWVFGDLPPSERYLSLIRDGAAELGLTRRWQERLALIPVAPLGSRAQPWRSEDFERRRGSTFV